MKKNLFLIPFVLFAFAALSQAPQQMNYQAVVRNSSNVLLANSKVGVLISITNAADSTFYSEKQTTTTNANGLFSIAIGTGTPIVGAFAKINWVLGGYYIKSQIDPTGGTNYSLTGSSLLSSVPYALFAQNGVPSAVNSGDILYWNGTKWAILPIGSNGNTLTICNGSLHWGACPMVTTLGIVKNVTVTRSNNRIPAFLSATISSNGGATITKRGFCWSLTSNPTLANSTSDSVPFISGSTVDTGGFTTIFPSLATNASYYCRAYAININGVAYSDQVQISNAMAAQATAPTVSAISVTLPYFPNPFQQGGPAQGYTTGDVTDDGYSPITAMGFCWSLSPNPTLSDSHSTTTTFIDTTSKSDTGKFQISSYFSLLDSVGTFYFRAYATNAYGTSYSSNVVVVGKKSSASAPTVSTDSISSYVTGKPLYVYGDVTYNGLVTTRERGVCWSTSPNPTWSNSHQVATFQKYPSSDTGYFYVKIDSTFLPNTTYYFRNYAYNGYAFGYGKQISVFTGTTTPGKYTVGQSYGGGYIFYIDSTNQHGLIAASSDVSGGVQWYNGGYANTGATGLLVGNGLSNTNSILKTQGTGSYAAYIASQTNNGYSDWFLPSKNELKLMYNNLYAKGIGNFVGNFYWTSSEYSTYEAWAQDFGQNSQFGYYKNNQARVRAIRKF